jgi:hypothetical protein
MHLWEKSGGYRLDAVHFHPTFSPPAGEERNFGISQNGVGLRLECKEVTTAIGYSCSESLSVKFFGSKRKISLIFSWRRKVGDFTGDKLNNSKSKRGIIDCAKP